MKHLRFRTAGFTIVEFLVAGFILVMLLTTISAYLVQHSNVTRRTQARNEVEAKVRTAAELVIQDLEVAGAKVVVNNGVSSAVDMFCAAALPTKCVADPPGDSEKLTVFYATSLRPTAPCRRIDYKLTSTNILQRVEQSQTGTNCKALETAIPTVATYNLNPLANNIQAFTLTYQCADDRKTTDPKTCYDNNPSTGDPSFPRQATVTIRGRSDTVSDIEAEVSLTATMPNLKR